MRRYSSNLAFVDLLFNLLVGFTSLFVIAFLLINPIAKTGVVDPPVVVMVELEWADDSTRDLDLYVRGPDGKVVSYSYKSNGFITLKKDDLGKSSDTFVINGERVAVTRNYEITTMTVLPDGDYVVNVHYFSPKGNPETVNLRITGLQPFGVHYEGSLTLSPGQERTIVTFRVVEGKVTDVRSDINVRLRGEVGP